MLSKEIERLLNLGKKMVSVDMSIAGTYYYIGEELPKNKITYKQFIKFKETCPFFDQKGSAIRFTVTRKWYWRGKQFPDE
jgi:hypothetical protein